MDKKRVLFVCTQNRMRSPTAEEVFRDYPGIEARSAGIGFMSENYVEEYLINWADIIFVMEKRHKDYIVKKFGETARHTRIVCLLIPDVYNYMDDDLIEILKDRVTPFLDGSKIGKGGD
jgi:predicted protein tyrosine phosphatase